MPFTRSKLRNLPLPIIGSPLFIVSNPKLVIAQGARYCVGLAALWLVSRISPAQLRSATPLFFAASLLPLLVVLVIGQGKHGNLWINLGVFYFQPSEVLKLSLPMMVAWFMHQQRLPPKFVPLLVAGGIIAVPTVLILLQPDFGTAMLVALSGAFVIYLAGLSWRLIALAGVSGAIAAGLAYFAPIHWFWMLRPYQKDRILTFRDPQNDPLGAGWNKIQSEIAVGSGGLGGKGYLMGTQNILGFLPRTVAPTDFIFSVIAEESGFAGAALVLGLYAVILGCGIRAAIRARDRLGRLLAAGITTSLFCHMFVNIAMTVGLAPITGLPLPLISYGGSFMISTMVGLGLVQSVYVRRIDR